MTQHNAHHLQIKGEGWKGNGSPKVGHQIVQFLCKLHKMAKTQHVLVQYKLDPRCPVFVQFFVQFCTKTGHVVQFLSSFCPVCTKTGHFIQSQFFCPVCTETWTMYVQFLSSFCPVCTENWTSCLSMVVWFLASLQRK